MSSTSYINTSSDKLCCSFLGTGYFTQGEGGFCDAMMEATSVHHFCVMVVKYGEGNVLFTDISVDRPDNDFLKFRMGTGLMWDYVAVK